MNSGDSLATNELGDATIAQEAEQSAMIGQLLGQFVQSKDELMLALQIPGLAPRVRRIGYEETARLVCEFFADEVATVSLPGTNEEMRAARPRWRGLPGRVQRIWRWADAVSQRALVPVRRVSVPWMQQWWTGPGLVLSGVAAGFLVTGHAGIALGLFVVRVTGSILAGGPPFADPGREGFFVVRQCRTIRASLRACLATHLSDAGVGLAIMLALWRSHPGWAQAAAGAVALSLFGTLARLAAERNGFRITRSAVERWVRNGGLLFGLLATTFIHSRMPVLHAPWLVLASAGLAGYGLTELLRVGGALTLDPNSPTLAITLSTTSRGRFRIDGMRTAGYRTKTVEVPSGTRG